jgi:glycosyltransferase involved in cell wall biosynthesis
MNYDTWILVPAYNEARVIGRVIGELKLHFSNVLVIDDCSSDNTRFESILKGALVVRHPINLGQGAALQTGMEYALSNGAQAIITFDSDGQHRVEDAILIANIIDRDGKEAICGSRFLGIEADNMPLSKKITLKMATIFTKIITGMSVTDAHNGLRGFSREAALSIYITQNRMAHATEIISLIKKNNINYKEVPVKIIYSTYSMEKGQRITNSLNIILDLLVGWGGKK